MNLRYLHLYHKYDIMIYIIKSINWCNNLSDNEIAMSVSNLELFQQFWKYGILTKFEMSKMKSRTL